MPLTVKEELRRAPMGRVGLFEGTSTLRITLHPCTCTSLLNGSNSFKVYTAKSEGEVCLLAPLTHVPLLGTAALLTKFSLKMN